MAAGTIEGGLLKVSLPKRNMRLGERTFEAVHTLLRVGQMERAGNDGEVPVAKLDEIPACLKCALLVRDGRTVAVPPLGSTVNADHGCARFAVRLCLSC